jgi:transposase
LSNEQVKFILDKYLAKEIRAKSAIHKLGLGRTRFYQLVQAYESDAANFTIEYKRQAPSRRLDPEIEQNILAELELEKTKIIENPKVPTKRYNYSYIQNILLEDYRQRTSLNTIIDRAKKNGYYLGRPPKKLHDREVITNFAGELVQHDSSHHLFAPDGETKWYLITSLDDYSRLLLYADLWLRESSFRHILALQAVVLRYGLPYSYYTDQHRIFRFVKDRDKNTPWAIYEKFTDDVDPQWKKVLKVLKIEPIYALSPQAKGKAERPYGWLQDHLVRTCVRKNITDIKEARKILQWEVTQYNHKRVHSTTGEIPIFRFNQALREDKSMFREFKLEPPHQSIKDIFCLRAVRRVDAYRKVSFQNNEFRLSGVRPRDEVELRFYPDEKTGLAEVRFWHQDTFLGSQRVRNTDYSIVQF